MPKFTAQQTARAFIALCNEHGDLLTNLKLQKLLYYAQGWHLGLYGEPLFGDPLEAWVHGPVVASVYREFRHCGYGPISLDVSPDEVPADLRDHVADVWIAYGDRTAYDLERMSHRERPWLEARGSLPPDAPSNNRLSDGVMREFFTAEANAHG